MDELLAKCSATFSAEELALLQKAITFVEKVHEHQKRESGEPFQIHPAAVAGMLHDMGMDHQSVIAGLLHDAVEDGENVTVDQIRAEFGEAIAGMVDGVTKLSRSGRGEYVTREEQQAENLRKMFLATAKDVRVVIIKLVDRLHNMRTLEYCNTGKRYRKAKETMELYAPLAHRLGMGQIKCELEDLAFFHLMPEEYENLQRAIAPQQQERQRLLEDVTKIIQAQLQEAGIPAEIHGRPKHLYSIYRKLIKQGITLDEIYDLVAVRVIVSTVNDCYAALGVIHSMWKPVPGRFKDYIAMPKTNMYRSLHTSLFSERGIAFEVQIRTQDMHRTAEYGIAAHWMYKEGRASQDELDSRISWLRKALEYEDDTSNVQEFVENIRKDFFSDFVFVLTPQGEIIDLPAGSTPLDFAYRIHTNVGHHCHHARVNGAMARLDYKLKTHDVVEIITSASQQGPSRDWLNIVKTQQAKAKIRQWFKKENREENIQRGRDMLEGAAKRHNTTLRDLTKPEYFEPLLKKFNMAGLDDIYAAVGYGGLTTGQVLQRLLEQYRSEQKAQRLLEKLEREPEAVKPPATRGVIVKGEPNLSVRFAHCCTPLPGDDIVGYITRGRGVSVHRRDCPNVAELMQDEERMIDVNWAAEEGASSYTASVFLKAQERGGILMDVSQLLVNLSISLQSVNAKTDRNGVVSVRLTFDVKDMAMLNTVIKNLRKIRSVTEVYRINT